MSSRIVCATVLVALIAIAASSRPAQSAPSTTVLWHFGFASAQAPSSSLAFRRAVASAIDRAAIARAVEASTPGVMPASRIQHSRAAGDTKIPITAQGFDAARARTLLRESGWTGPITILVGGSTTDWTMAFEQAVTQSLERTLGLTVTINRLPRVAAVVQEARAGRAGLFLAGWRSSPRDFAYPWIAMGLAETYFPGNREMQVLMRTRQVLGLERLMLDGAHVIPIVAY
jgi:ABC-type transport system substrate-binding protein